MPKDDERRAVARRLRNNAEQDTNDGFPIEPEPERTCHAVHEENDCGEWEYCSECGDIIDVNWHKRPDFCPSCGARVVS